MKRKVVLLTVAALVSALTAAAALSASPSVTITAPKSNSKVSLRQNPRINVTGTAAFAAASSGSTEFFLRRDGCGTSADNPHMSVTSGTDAGDGCGLIIDAVGPVGDVAPQASFTDYPAVDGMPLSYDGTQPINGQISLTGAQVGIAEVDVDLQALVGGNAVDIGSTTASALLDPTGNSTPVPFTIPGNVSLNGSDIQALDLRVTTHGPNVYSGFVALSGASWVNIPSNTASVNKSVQISVDDPSFSNPTTATITGLNWSVSIPTPNVGKHTIYAESTQGFSTSAPASVVFSVTK
jgi:hypothetical protein